MGAKQFDLIWVFKTPKAYDDFIRNGFELTGEAVAAARAYDKGGSLGGAIEVSPGVWLYQMTENGLAAEITVKGTLYYLDKELNGAFPRRAATRAALPLTSLDDPPPRRWSGPPRGRATARAAQQRETHWQRPGSRRAARAKPPPSTRSPGSPACRR